MDRKLIYFLIGFAAFYLLYNKFVLDKVVKPPLQEKPPVTAPVTPNKTEVPAPATSTPTPAVTAPLAPTPTQAAKKIVVDTPLYRGEFSSQGGVLTSFRLKKYHDDFGQPLEMVPQDSSSVHPLELQFDDKQLTQFANQSIYSASQDSLSLSNKQSGTIEFSFSDGKYSFRKSFAFQADSYLIHLLVSGHQPVLFLEPVSVWPIRL